MRTFMEQTQRRPLDSNFDLKSYRSQVKDRLNMSIATDVNQSKFSSVKKETRQGVPSFDNLQARIRDFSQSRLGTLTFDNNTPQKSFYSPYKARGMQNIISDTLGVRSFESVKQQKQYESSPQPKYQSSFNQSSQKNSLQLNQNFQPRKQGRNLSDMVQLNEIVALRNKIEQSKVNRATLTSTYVSELVKLAQAITTSLKQE